jgi:hypothetical protein
LREKVVAAGFDVGKTMTQIINLTETKSNRRRSRRVLIHVSLEIVGGTNGESFREETGTLAINAHGALILLAAPVELEQHLRLRHRGTQEEQDCTVVFVGEEQEGKTQVGIEFLAPAPSFWRIAFPPEDWTPAHPDASDRLRA